MNSLLLINHSPCLHRLFRAAGWIALSGLSMSLPGCLDRPIEPINPRSSGSFIEKLNQATVDKIDLLLVIDNSSSMADKQQILAQAVPNLIERLVNPRCIDASGFPVAQQPGGPLEPCPMVGTVWSTREFVPVTDIHIGIISSSLGGHGADVCPNETSQKCASGTTHSNNDQGHLLSRLDPCAEGQAPTYESKGFLAWDPAQKQTPPGEADRGALVDHLRDMVVGVGQVGCGYESQLESWYRFLVDPEPYASLSVENGVSIPQGLDSTLLLQRQAFLRPDSLVAVLMLTDENDCSIMESGSYFIVGQQHQGNGLPFRMPKARAECAADPNDPCCMSCAQDRGECPYDPTCFDQNGGIQTLSADEDHSNLRCFDQKRRFGVDFLYPVERYRDALTKPVVANRRGELVPNPLFSDLDPSDGIKPVRSPGLVFLAGLVGVPWQDVAADPKDLSKGYKRANALNTVDPALGYSAWDLMLGDPKTGVLPRDPLMIESQAQRMGVHPLSAENIGGDCQNAPNSINGCEHAPALGDLQYACVFPLPQPVDCSAGNIPGCDCTPDSAGNPLCMEQPSKPGDYSLQARAKAYPSIRELEVLRGIGDQAIVASVCAAEVQDMAAPHYGYQPAIDALVDRLKERIGNQCLPRSLPLDENKQVPCTVIEAKDVNPGEVGACNACDSPGRRPVAQGHETLVDAAKKDLACQDGGCNCFCEVAPLEGAAQEACQNKVSASFTDPATGEEAHGYCYIDANATPAVGNPALVSGCPETERQMIRFMGDSPERSRSVMFIHCAFDRPNP